MNLLKRFIFEDDRAPYVSVFVALIAAILMVLASFGLSINLKVGDRFNLIWLMFLNILVNWNWLFISVAIVFGLTAMILTLGDWKKVIIISTSIAIIVILGSMAVLTGLGGTYTYAVATTTQYTNYTFQAIHAYLNRDLMNGADYVLAQCDLSISNCQVIDRFDDFPAGKPVSFFVGVADHELYLRLGDETKLISKS